MSSSHFSFPALFPSPQWVSQIPFGNSPIPFGLSYLELGQLRKELEQNGFRPEPVGTEKCDDGNTLNGDECKRDGASQAAYSNVINYDNVTHPYQSTVVDLMKSRYEDRFDGSINLPQVNTGVRKTSPGKLTVVEFDDLDRIVVHKRR